jgi:hypothetical protein
MRLLGPWGGTTSARATEISPIPMSRRCEQGSREPSKWLKVGLVALSVTKPAVSLACVGTMPPARSASPNPGTRNAAAPLAR